jgi:hypothetical protein
MSTPRINMNTRPVYYDFRESSLAVNLGLTGNPFLTLPTGRGVIQGLAIRITTAIVGTPNWTIVFALAGLTGQINDAVYDGTATTWTTSWAAFQVSGAAVPGAAVGDCLFLPLFLEYSGSAAFNSALIAGTSGAARVSIIHGVKL